MQICTEIFVLSFPQNNLSPEKTETNWRAMAKISDYVIQHAESGFEEKVKNQKRHIFKTLKK